MKKISLIALVGLSAGFFAACSDSSSSGPAVPPKSQSCAAGVSAECLAGTWSFKGPENESGVVFAGADFSAAPGSLTFNEDGTFVFEAPVASVFSKDCLVQDSENKMYGSWTLNGGALTLKSVSTCIRPSAITVNPTVAVEGALVKMKFGNGVFWFSFNEGLNTVERGYYSETFTISAN